MLIDAWKTECVMMTKTATADTIGGAVNTWTEGETFVAAIVKDTTQAARTAEKHVVTEAYTVTVDKNLAIQLHDVFKRKADGTFFRVTSNIVDSKTPSVASFQFGQVTAERMVDLT